MAKYRKHRVTHCWQCGRRGKRRTLDSRLHSVHDFCGAITCPDCGACGCDNPEWTIYKEPNGRTSKEESMSSPLDPQTPQRSEFLTTREWKIAVADYWSEYFRKAAMEDLDTEFPDDEDLDLPF